MRVNESELAAENRRLRAQLERGKVNGVLGFMDDHQLCDEQLRAAKSERDRLAASIQRVRDKIEEFLALGSCDCHSYTTAGGVAQEGHECPDHELLRALDSARGEAPVPCATCGGRRTITDDRERGEVVPCPDCGGESPVPAKEVSDDAT